MPTQDEMIAHICHLATITNASELADVVASLCARRYVGLSPEPTLAVAFAEYPSNP